MLSYFKLVLTIIGEGVRLVWLDIEYTNRDLIPDSAVVRMLVAIRTTVFYVSRPVPAASEGLWSGFG
jgi:hypothetical protein